MPILSEFTKYKKEEKKIFTLGYIGGVTSLRGSVTVLKSGLTPV